MGYQLPVNVPKLPGKWTVSSLDGHGCYVPLVLHDLEQALCCSAPVTHGDCGGSRASEHEAYQIPKGYVFSIDFI